MVRVNLRRSVGLPGGRLYGPGQGVEVPEELARRLSPDSTAPQAEGFDAANATKEELVAEAERRGITVTRGDGKDGDPLVSDYRAALG